MFNHQTDCMQYNNRKSSSFYYNMDDDIRIRITTENNEKFFASVDPSETIGKIIDYINNFLHFKEEMNKRISLIYQNNYKLDKQIINSYLNEYLLPKENKVSKFLKDLDAISCSFQKIDKIIQKSPIPNLNLKKRSIVRVNTVLKIPTKLIQKKTNKSNSMPKKSETIDNEENVDIVENIPTQVNKRSISKKSNSIKIDKSNENTKKNQKEIKKEVKPSKPTVQYNLSKDSKEEKDENLDQKLINQMDIEEREKYLIKYAPLKTMEDLLKEPPPIEKKENSKHKSSKSNQNPPKCAPLETVRNEKTIEPEKNNNCGGFAEKTEKVEELTKIFETNDEANKKLEKNNTLNKKRPLENKDELPNIPSKKLEIENIITNQLSTKLKKNEKKENISINQAKNSKMFENPIVLQNLLEACENSKNLNESSQINGLNIEENDKLKNPNISEENEKSVENEEKENKNEKNHNKSQNVNKNKKQVKYNEKTQKNIKMYKNVNVEKTANNSQKNENKDTNVKSTDIKDFNPINELKNSNVMEEIKNDSKEKDVENSENNVELEKKDENENVDNNVSNDKNETEEQVEKDKDVKNDTNERKDIMEIEKSDKNETENLKKSEKSEKNELNSQKNKSVKDLKNDDNDKILENSNKEKKNDLLENLFKEDNFLQKNAKLRKKQDPHEKLSKPFNLPQKISSPTEKNDNEVSGGKLLNNLTKKSFKTNLIEDTKIDKDIKINKELVKDITLVVKEGDSSMIKKTITKVIEGNININQEKMTEKKIVPIKNAESSKVFEEDEKRLTRFSRSQVDKKSKDIKKPKNEKKQLPNNEKPANNNKNQKSQKNQKTNETAAKNQQAENNEKIYSKLKNFNIIDITSNSEKETEEMVSSIPQPQQKFLAKLSLQLKGKKPEVKQNTKEEKKRNDNNKNPLKEFECKDDDSLAEEIDEVMTTVEKNVNKNIIKKSSLRKK